MSCAILGKGLLPWHPSSFYHIFTLLHILLTMYNMLTLTSIKVEITSHVLPTLDVFGSQASTKETTMGLFIIEIIFLM